MLRDTSAARTSSMSVFCARVLPEKINRARNAAAEIADLIGFPPDVGGEDTTGRPSGGRASPNAPSYPISSIPKGITMRVAQTRLSIDTAPREIKEITAEIRRWVERQNIALGLLTVYITHTSASLLIQERGRRSP